MVLKLGAIALFNPDRPTVINKELIKYVTYTVWIKLFIREIHFWSRGPK